jgi:dihydrodipicolinate synthase/N-acetylneuraminate lyase
MTREEIRAPLTGPVASVRTPFHRDGSIAHDALRGSGEFDIEAGSRSLVLTYGDSLFSVLAEQEVADVTRAVTEQARGQAMVVAAERAYATSRAVEGA